VNDVWLVVALVGGATIVIKGVGPVFLGGRELPSTLGDVLLLLAPALLSALVVTQLLGGDREIVLDERLLGIAAAIVGILLRLPLLAIVIVAAAVTAGVRALG
jgi:branched-subunit amino acid transport protein